MQNWKITFISDKTWAIYLRVRSDGLAELTPSIQWADLLCRSKEGGRVISNLLIWQVISFASYAFIFAGKIKQEQSYQSFLFEHSQRKKQDGEEAFPPKTFPFCLLWFFPFSWLRKTWNPTFWGSTFLLYQLGTPKCVCVCVRVRWMAFSPWAEGTISYCVRVGSEEGGRV